MPFLIAEIMATNAKRVIQLSRNQHFEVIRKTDQTSIKHPVHRAR